MLSLCVLFTGACEESSLPSVTFLFISKCWFTNRYTRQFFCSMTDIKCPLSSLKLAPKNPWASLSFATNAVWKRMRVDQTHATITWESIHLSTNLFPNNKAALQLHLGLVSFFYITFNDCHSITVFYWMSVYLCCGSWISKCERFLSNVVHAGVWEKWFSFYFVLLIGQLLISIPNTLVETRSEIQRLC